MLINNATLHYNVLTLIISNNFDNKVCIPKVIAIGISEVISNGSYRINEVALTARDNDLKTDTQTPLI